MIINIIDARTIARSFKLNPGLLDVGDSRLPLCLVGGLGKITSTLEQRIGFRLFL